METRDALGVLFLIFLGMAEVRARQPCSPKFLRQNAMVCVCNATYCDTVDPVSLPDVGSFVKYTTSRDGQCLERSEGKTDANSSSGIVYTYDPSVQHQSIKGFGGALTDVAAINILNLSYEAQNQLLRSYFSEEGIEYNMLRWPIGCSDFSTRPYSYDDRCVDDFELKCFELAPEDTNLRIPLFHRIRAHAKRPLSLVGSPWSSPAWLRVNNKVEGKSRLKGKPGDIYHKAWAHYLIRFLEEYAKNNITFWALSTQNEPVSGFIAPWEKFPCNYFSPRHQRNFIIRDLGPALHASCHTNVHLLILDDMRFLLPIFAKQVLGNSTARAFVSGIGLHWYFDRYTPVGLTLDITHRLYPDYFLLYTEACNGYQDKDVNLALGSWERGTTYSSSILTNLNHFVTGWIDWNLALIMGGGSNFVGNHMDSPVIVNPLKDEFYKQPMFYHLGHFSKFIPEGSVRVGFKSNCSFQIFCKLETSAFLTPDGTAVAVVLNDWFLDIPFTISDDRVGYIKDRARAHSIQTYLWRRS
ncbi:lysosomal acid glucosylceramidase-like [Erythrolamprus reginae]|uniref:lysosomal acid glucosylceramidase-like n=1 Tax=Erythrolamprus reginae TaxID=121349 RepID=UPI00396C3468